MSKCVKTKNIVQAVNIINSLISNKQVDFNKLIHLLRS
ncbi:MAG: hypothetical protein K0S61_706 [Anaerocolumna sp.]|jgi:hypothetical protein|nr:hypothetical protein [Anaerocolumna sp.]